MPLLKPSTPGSLRALGHSLLGAALALLIAAPALRASVLDADPDGTTQIRYLSGTGKDDTVLWDFLCTGGRRSGVWTKIPVPSCWEQQGFGTYEYGLEHRPSKENPSVDRLVSDQGKYRLSFTVPANWQSGRVRLVFDGVMTDADVRVNGQSAGPIHQGSFYRFRYDVTSLLKFDGPNLLEVTVSEKSASPGVNAAERFADYWNFAGIFRPVFLEAVPAEFIDRTAIDAKADGHLTADVFLGGAIAPGTTVQGQIVDRQGKAAGAAFSADVPVGADRVTLETTLAQPALWTAETPNLYRLRLALRRAGSQVHLITTAFGFRTFEVRAGDGLYLNGAKVRLKGADRHSFWPETGRTLSREICYDDVRLMKEANMNAVRMSHYPPDADFLQACDELGLYVLDELGGWHGAYDTEVGRKLVGEMVRRDVNHPSILFWDNGNEGGNNLALDNQYALWDPQHRAVLHPWATFSSVNTAHYRNYAMTAKLAEGPDIFMPTEFLHGLYDGGAGSGLEDYWALMGHKPRAAGGFIWALLDESVARTDENGRLDSKESWAPDGIVGPHREKEGSFNAIRQIWSPVQVGPATLPENFDGTLAVENDFDFVDLSQCTFAWELARFPAPGSAATGHLTLARGQMAGPAAGPHASGSLQLPLPPSWREAEALLVTARDPAGHALWTWSWSLKPVAPFVSPPATGDKPAIAASVQAGIILVQAGDMDARFDSATTELGRLSFHGQTLSLGHGPRLVAYRRKGRRFEDVAGPSTRVTQSFTSTGDYATVSATYSGNLRSVRWRIYPSGDAILDYETAFEGPVDLLGIAFDYPETQIKAKRWLGGGPYHVWQNRLKGATLDVWKTAYNDALPGEVWSYPEFKGFFSQWQWTEFSTTEGRFAYINEGHSAYLGVYSPNDGWVAPVQQLPKLGLGVYEVIPAMGNKNVTPEFVGPQSQTPQVTGLHHGTLHIRLLGP